MTILSLRCTPSMPNQRVSPFFAAIVVAFAALTPLSGCANAGETNTISSDVRATNASAVNVSQNTTTATSDQAATSSTRIETRSSAQTVSGQTYADKIGVELDDATEGSRLKVFVDLGKVFRPMTQIGSDKAAPTDANGWPTSDAQAVFFDIRPFGTWWGPDKVDDPAKFQPDWSGTYHISFNGQATIKPLEGATIQFVGQKYNPTSNLTTVDMIVPKGTGLVALAFVNTKRTATGAVNSGITNIKMIRPGYALDTRQIFTTEFLNAVKPFVALRYMDLLATNANPGFYGDAGHHVTQWKDRRLTTDATQSNIGDKHGVAWEYLIALANTTNKDIWINVPVSASDDYVKQLATLLKTTLKPSLKIYIEHSNEVWNFGFPQYIYNKLAAVDEVGKGGSTLNNDGSTDQEVWAHRRHAKRLVEISNTFKSVFGASAMTTRIRPVYASWLIQPDAYYKDVLAWVNKTYGAPKNFFYGVADAAYYNDQKASKTASVTEIIDTMRRNQDENMAFRKQIQAIADGYGLKHLQYEVGPDNGGGSTDNVANRILANRDPRMKELVIRDARNWFAMGGDMYMYFAMTDSYSRSGSWGLGEDIANTNTPKWQGIYVLTGTKPMVTK